MPRLVGKWRRGVFRGFPDVPAPANWTMYNIGSANPAPNVSSADLSRGDLRFSTGGTGVGATDVIAFASMPLSGTNILSAQLTAYVESVTATTGNAEIGGLMIRRGTGATDQFAALGFSAVNLKFQYRPANGSAVTTVTRAGVAPPYYLRLIVNGGNVIPYISTNGILWNPFGGDEIFPTSAVMNITGNRFYGVYGASGYNTGATTTVTVATAARQILLEA